MVRDSGSGQIVPKGEGKWLLRVDYGRSALTNRRDRRAQVFLGSKRDAQKKLNELLRVRDTGLNAPIDADRQLMGEWVLGWRSRHYGEGRISSKGHERYLGVVRKHILPAIGNMKVKDVRAQHITELKVHWLRDHAPSTVYKHLVILRQALQDAVVAGLIPRNPMDGVTKPSINSRREQRALSESEVAALLRVSADTRFDVPIRFTLATGVREGELLSLEWPDIDLEAGVVRLRGTKTKNSRRTIEVSSSLCRLLREHRQVQLERKMKLRDVWPEAPDLVFPSIVGTKWYARAFLRDYRTLLDRSEIERSREVNWHALRHTAASLWILRGADIFTVARRLGHASAAFTMDTYAHLLKGQQEVVKHILDDLVATR